MGFPFIRTARIRREDALKHLLDCAEVGRTATFGSLAGTMGSGRKRAAEVLAGLHRDGLATLEGDGYSLTEAGRREAVRVVRTHRLVETWLARESGLPPAAWHRAAHESEHHLDAEATNDLADRLNNPRFDPHGDPIPTRAGDLPAQPRIPLALWPPGRDAVVRHVEDEPEALFRHLGRLGLAPGTLVEGPEPQADGSVRARIEGRDVRLPAEWAALVHVGEAEGQERTAGAQRLSDLPVGASTRVRALAPSCTGLERRRLLDLGVVPGTELRCAFGGPFGWPRSYRVRGTLIALRAEQAARILVDPVSRP